MLPLAHARRAPATREYAAATSYQLVQVLWQDQRFKFINAAHADTVWAMSASLTFMLIAWISGGDILRRSPSHPSPFFRYLWSMTAVASASECKPFGQDHEATQQGFGEIAGWFRRNSLTLPVGESPPTIEVFKAEYDRVRATLSKESALLDELGAERLDGATAWLKTNGVK